MKDTQNATISYLSAVTKIRAGMTSIGAYRSLEEFVLKNGRRFKLKQRPKSIKKMKERHCFQNCYQLSLESEYGSNKLRYVEGYATSLIPTLHAWCVDKEGSVIDPTWEKGTDYVGLVIPKLLMVGTALTRGCFGVIDNWEQEWPLLRFGINNLMKMIKTNKFLETFEKGRTNV